MQIEILKEFVIFTRYSNFTKASEALNMTQSNLSKHMQQLENELGFTLIVRSKKLTLTPAGSHFLNRIHAMLGSFDDLVVECQQIQAKHNKEQIIQEPPYPDKAAECYYRYVEDIRESNPDAPVRFMRMRRRYPKENLKYGKVDLALVYECGDTAEIESRYDQEGFDAKFLTEEPVVLWCSKHHRFSKRKSLTIEDLKGVPIMTPHGTYSPTRYAIIDYCKIHGFDPVLNVYKTDLQSEFMFADVPESVYLFPARMQEDLRLSIRGDMVFIPFKNDCFKIKSFAVTNKTDNDIPSDSDTPVVNEEFEW